MDLSRFKSGSDIRGYALGDESNPLYMSDDMVMRCCAAFVNWLKTRTGKDKLYISVGHDSRLSAERIKAAAVKALTSHGVSVADCSLCSTPAMFMTTVETRRTGTASNSSPVTAGLTAATLPIYSEPPPSCPTR